MSDQAGQGKASTQAFFAPDVIQTSEMDCGPASLKCLLESFGIHASYGRLREACQTSVDGTSIDDIEALANRLGLDAEQIMLPADHLLLDGFEALPAMLVVRSPSGMTHFVVAYSQHWGYVQVMDPAVGRRWVKKRDLLQQAFIHSYPISAETWRTWATDEGFTGPLKKRMSLLGIPAQKIEALVAEATGKPGWAAIAILDAAVRLAQSFVDTKAVERGMACAQLVGSLCMPGKAKYGEFSIPQAYFSVLPNQQPTDQEETVEMRGVVLVRVNGLLGEQDVEDGSEPQREPLAEEGDPARKKALEKQVNKILTDETIGVEKRILAELKSDGLLTPIILLAGFVISSFGFALQGYLLQSLFQIRTIFPVLDQRISALAALMLFLLLLTLIDAPLQWVALAIARKLETRMRILLLKKLPLLGDRYFHSRLPSDMNNRANGLRTLGELPFLAIRFSLSVFNMLLTTIGILWLDQEMAWFSLLASLAFLGYGALLKPILEEADMKARTHDGALSRFYLDGLRGILPLRAHSGESAFRRQFEGLLSEWVRASNSINQVGLMAQGFSALLYTAYSVWVGVKFANNPHSVGSDLLLFYWALNLPSHASTVVGFIQQYPQVSNNLRRVLEPLEAPEEMAEGEAIDRAEVAESAGQGSQSGTAAVSITFQNVDVEVAGKLVLQGLNLVVEPGEQIAVVGSSGAGKSSLVGLLLGWHTPVAGVCLVDGKPPTGEHLQKLRLHTAWVDPEVRLWNKTVWQNIKYGNGPEMEQLTHELLAKSELYPVVEHLAQGLQTTIGEGGGMVSGGEGQRIRLARALDRDQIRLAILDEPFRGLDARQRAALLKMAREHWRDATMLCVTHDVIETLHFGRVLVVENGSIIEDGQPALLAADSQTRYSQYLQAEQNLRTQVWANPAWRNWTVEHGKIRTV